jgi:mxaJ protein
MSSASRFASIAAALALASAAGVFLASRGAAAAPGALRVCADPNNLPFSNARGEGFENEIAALLARDLGRTVSYYWFPQRRGFLRQTLRAGLCDVVMALPARTDAAATTKPYYRSTYVFVTPRTRPPVRSFDDPSRRALRIGVQLVGDDKSNPPPAEALAARDLSAQVRGFTVYGDYSNQAPQREIVDAVARGEVDTAVVWGPVGGYFAAREPVALAVTPVVPAVDPQAGPLVFDIAIGVRTTDRSLRAALDRALVRQRAGIDAILHKFSVPVVQATKASAQ